MPTAKCLLPAVFLLLHTQASAFTFRLEVENPNVARQAGDEVTVNVILEVTAGDNPVYGICQTITHTTALLELQNVEFNNAGVTQVSPTANPFLLCDANPENSCLEEARSLVACGASASEFRLRVEFTADSSAPALDTIRDAPLRIATLTYEVPDPVQPIGPNSTTVDIGGLVFTQAGGAGVESPTNVPATIQIDTPEPGPQYTLYFGDLNCTRIPAEPGDRVEVDVFFTAGRTLQTAYGFQYEVRYNTNLLSLSPEDVEVLLDPAMIALLEAGGCNGAPPCLTAEVSVSDQTGTFSYSVEFCPGQCLGIPWDDLQDLLTARLTFTFNPEAGAGVRGTTIVLANSTVFTLCNDPDLNPGNDCITTTPNVCDVEILRGTPDIDVTPESLDFGPVSTGTTRELIVTITNPGSIPLDVSRVRFTGATSEDFGILTEPRSNFEVAPGASWEIVVDYAPNDLGPDSGLMQIRNSAEWVTVPVSGTGVIPPMPAISIDPVALSFGEVSLGDSGTLDLTISNAGTGDLEVTSLTLNEGTSAEFGVDPPFEGRSVAPGASTVVQVVYTPVDENLDEGSLLISSNDPDAATLEVPLAGTGVPAPVPSCDVDPPALEFGQTTTGSTSILTVTITNGGNADLTIDEVVLGDGSSDDYSIPSRPANGTVVAPEASVTVDVQYAPTDEGADSGTVRIACNDPSNPEVIVSLSGSAVLPPVPGCSVEPSSLDFGQVTAGSSQTLAVTVTSSGTASLIVSSLALGEGSSGDFVLAASPETPLELASGESAQVEVSYLPGEGGTDSGTLRIECNDPDTPEVVVSLDGTGVPLLLPNSVVEPDGLDFGEVEEGTSSALEVTISNTGEADLDVTSIGLGEGTSSDFSITSGPASAGIGPGMTVGVEVTYAPNDEGSDTGTLRIECDDPDTPVVIVSLSGSSVVPAPEVTLTVDPEDLTEVEAVSPVDDAVIHRVTLQAGASEALKLESIRYLPAAGTTLEGIQTARLFVDLNANDLEDPGETTNEIVVAPGAVEIVFPGLDYEIPAGGAVVVTLIADLEVASEEGGGAALVLPTLRGPSPGAVLLCAWALLLLGLLHCCRRLQTFKTLQRGLAYAGAVVAVSCLLSVVVSCSSGGGGGKKAKQALETAVQVGILAQDDIALRGVDTNTKADIIGFPVDGILGTPFVVTSE